MNPIVPVALLTILGIIIFRLEDDYKTHHTPFPHQVLKGAFTKQEL